MTERATHLIPTNLKVKASLNFCLQNLFGEKAFFGYLQKNRINLHNKIIEHLKNKTLGKKLEISRIENITRKDFHLNFLKPGLPVILKGMAKDWECCKKWSLEGLKEKVGEAKVTLADAEGLTGHKLEGKTDTKSFAEIIDEIQSGQPTYMRFNPFLDQYQSLQKDINLDWLNSMINKPNLGTGFHFFVGGGDNFTPTHNAFTGNLFIMIDGKKTWRMTSTAYSSVLNPEILNTVYNSSYIHLEDSLNEKKIGIDKLDYYEFELEKGDILYNPPFMWHSVFSPVPSISAGFRFTHLSGALKASKSMTFTRIFAQNPPLWKSFFISKKDTNLNFTYRNKKLKKI